MLLTKCGEEKKKEANMKINITESRAFIAFCEDESVKERRRVPTVEICRSYFSRVYAGKTSMRINMYI